MRETTELLLLGIAGFIMFVSGTISVYLRPIEPPVGIYALFDVIYDLRPMLIVFGIIIMVVVVMMYAALRDMRTEDRSK